jgi:hypothetical protein
VITLGTPFHGSALAAAILAGRRIAPVLPADRMRAIALTAPGLYDLLPIYRCVDTGLDGLLLTAAHVRDFGGDEQLTDTALRGRRRMRDAGFTLPGHRAVIGVDQPTETTMTIERGAVRLQQEAFRPDPRGGLAREQSTGIPSRWRRPGDGTVYRDAAHPGPTTPAVYMPAQHGALPRHRSVLAYVRAVLTEVDEHLGPPAGTADIGLTMPDHVQTGQPWTIRLDSARSPAGIVVVVTDVEDEEPVTRPRLSQHDGYLAAEAVLPQAGIYRVTIDTGGTAGTELTQLVLATDPDAVR